jgi:hypothetical protein
VRESLDIGDETHRGRDPEIGFEQQFLELLERIQPSHHRAR